MFRLLTYDFNKCLTSSCCGENLFSPLRFASNLSSPQHHLKQQPSFLLLDPGPLLFLSNMADQHEDLASLRRKIALLEAKEAEANKIPTKHPAQTNTPQKNKFSNYSTTNSPNPSRTSDQSTTSKQRQFPVSVSTPTRPASPPPDRPTVAGKSPRVPPRPDKVTKPTNRNVASGKRQSGSQPQATSAKSSSSNGKGKEKRDKKAEENDEVTDVEEEENEDTGPRLEDKGTFQLKSFFILCH